MMSIARPLNAAAPVAPRGGAELRAARERLGWSLRDIAASLRIRLSHLEALEEGHIALLPGNAYALGYVRSYARALGLDAEDVVRRIKDEAAEVGQRPDLAFPVPMPDRGLPAGAMVLIGLVLSIGAYAGWYKLSGDGHLPAEAVVAIPERLAPLAEQALPPPAVLISPAPVLLANRAPANPSAQAPGQIATSETPGLAFPGSAIPGTAVPGTATPGAATPGSAILGMAAEPAPRAAQFSPTSAAAAPVHDLLAGPFATADASVLAGVAPAVTAATAAVAGDDVRIVVRANADAWIQVKERGGAVLVSRVLKAGEAWPVPRQDNLLLTTGNAGGTDLLVDGTPTPSLGQSGAVRHDLLLDPDLLKGGKVVPAPVLATARGRQ